VTITAPELTAARTAATVPARVGNRARQANLVGAVLVLVAAGYLAVELRHVDLIASVRSVRPGQLGIAVACIALSLVAAAYNLIGFSPLRLRLLPTVLAQLAVSGIRLIAPSAVSTPAIATRYLVRSGASTPDALATVGVAQTAQLVVTATVVAVLGLASGQGAQLSVSPVGVLVAVTVAGAVAAAAVLAANRSIRARLILVQARHSLHNLGEHARHRPGQVGVGLLASAGLTLTHVLAFAFCVSAAGGHASLLTLTMIYLGAATAGSLIPTPGGVGAVEAALIAGLTTTGMVLPVATAAALLSRLVSVWLLAAPGWLALVTLRRRALL
jgi:uncharacterized protein (TIRG00374 family)